jgi:hypothetical protein
VSGSESVFYLDSDLDTAKSFRFFRIRIRIRNTGNVNAYRYIIKTTLFLAGWDGPVSWLLHHDGGLRLHPHHHRVQPLRGDLGLHPHAPLPHRYIPQDSPHGDAAHCL